MPEALACSTVAVLAYEATDSRVVVSGVHVIEPRFCVYRSTGESKGILKSVIRCACVSVGIIGVAERSAVPYLFELVLRVIGILGHIRDTQIGHII